MRKIEYNFQVEKSADSMLTSLRQHLHTIFAGETGSELTSQLLFTPSLMGGFLGSDLFRFLAQDLPPEFFTEEVLTKGPYVLLSAACLMMIVATATGVWFARMLRRGAMSFEVNSGDSLANGITPQDVEIGRIASDELQSGTNPDDVISL